MDVDTEEDGTGFGGTTNGFTKAGAGSAAEITRELAIEFERDDCTSEVSTCSIEVGAVISSLFVGGSGTSECSIEIAPAFSEAIIGVEVAAASFEFVEVILVADEDVCFTIDTGLSAVLD